MTPPRFRFTIANLLWATFWAAVGMAAWTTFERHEGASVAIWVPALAIAMGSPFAAVGALFGIARAGLVMGLAVAALVIILFLLGLFRTT